MSKGHFKVCHEWYSQKLFASLPDARFIFGDNTERWGRGGQAAVCRDHPQAIGIATLWSPGKFFTDSPEAREVVAADFKKAESALDAGHDVYWPADGIGTGLARLQQEAPGVFTFVKSERDRLADQYP